MYSEQRRGELIAYANCFLWSLFPIITVISVTTLPALWAAALSTLFSAFFFAAVLTWRGNWTSIPAAAWKHVLLATLLTGVIFYGLVFTGYSFTTAGNGAVVSQMEVFFSFLIVNLLWKHERFVPMHALGAALMVGGSLLILLPDSSGHWNIGDLLILLATTMSPVGNIYAQQARKLVSSEMFMFLRSGISTPFLVLLALAFAGTPSALAVHESLWYLAINGVLLLGLSKILWMEAIHRLPIAKTVALSEVQTPLTLLFAFLLLNQPVTVEQVLGFLPMVGGVLLLTKSTTQ